jgi:hypothetical protein
MINLLTCDPGSTNFGFAVTNGRIMEVKSKPVVQFKIAASGLCPCPINKVKDTKDLRAKQIAFKEWFLKIVKDHDITAVGLERFQTRGLLGPLVEYVGIMTGIILSNSEGMPFKVYGAATWKNAVRRSTGDPEWLNQTYKIAKVQPHQLDASLMGVWLLHQGAKIQDFGELDLVERRDKFLDMIESTSLERLVNRKLKR